MASIFIRKGKVKREEKKTLCAKKQRGYVFDLIITIINGSLLLFYNNSIIINSREWGFDPSSHHKRE